MALTLNLTSALYNDTEYVPDLLMEIVYVKVLVAPGWTVTALVGVAAPFTINGSSKLPGILPWFVTDAVIVTSWPSSTSEGDTLREITSNEAGVSGVSVAQANNETDAIRIADKSHVRTSACFIVNCAYDGKIEFLWKQA
jgi:hypothetical protein